MTIRQVLVIEAAPGVALMVSVRDGCVMIEAPTRAALISAPEWTALVAFIDAALASPAVRPPDPFAANRSGHSIPPGTMTRSLDDMTPVTVLQPIPAPAYPGDATPMPGPTADLLATASQERVEKSTGAPVAAQFGPKPFPIDEQAVLARLRELAVDGQMPSRIIWDAERGNCPGYATLSRHRKWSAWAQLAGLGMKTKGRRGYDLPREHIGDGDEGGAAQPAAPFRNGIDGSAPQVAPPLGA